MGCISLQGRRALGGVPLTGPPSVLLLVTGRCPWSLRTVMPRNFPSSRQDTWSKHVIPPPAPARALHLGWVRMAGRCARSGTHPPRLPLDTLQARRSLTKPQTVPGKTSERGPCGPLGDREGHWMAHGQQVPHAASSVQDTKSRPGAREAHNVLPVDALHCAGAARAYHR